MHRHGELGGREHRIVALVHRRGAGVVGKALDRDLGPPEPDDTLHHPDLESRLLQQAALLDVQFEITGEVSPLPDRLAQPGNVAPDDADAFADGLAGPGHPVEVGVGQRPDGELAPDGSAFLVLPDHHLDRTAEPHTLFAE